MAITTHSSVVIAKQSLVRNVIKHSSPKQHSGSEPEKPSKHDDKKVLVKQNVAKLAKADNHKAIVKQAQAKSPKLAASEKAEKSVIKHVLVRSQKLQPKELAHAIKPLTPAAPSQQLGSLPVANLNKPNRRNELLPNLKGNVPDDDLSANFHKPDQLTAQVDQGDVVYNDPSKPDVDPFTPLPAGQKHRATLYKIKRGDTIPTIFQSLNLSSYELHKIINNRTLNRQFRHLIPGKTLSINTNARGELTSVAYKSDIVDLLNSNSELNTASDQTTSTNDIASATSFTERPSVKHKGQVKHVSANALIQTSLERAARNADLPKQVTQQLTDIFAWDIDFSQNLRPNDQFTVVYEQFFENGRPVDIGDIVAAEFINQGERHQAVRYKDSSGNIGYYTPEGEGMRRAFLRNPLDFARVSSYFNPSRKHPILNRIRAHKGVDYAASTGTPIKSTGDGKLSYKGVKGGYGRVVMIEHGNEYTTLYAHLSDYNDSLNEGDYVKQGQVIGYVGKSGLATGPHLHYEFLVNGVHKDPLTVSLPHSIPINKSLLGYFKTQTRPLLAQLELAKSTMLAKNTTLQE